MVINPVRREEIIAMRNDYLINPPGHDYISLSTHYEFIDIVCRKYGANIHTTYLYVINNQVFDCWIAPIVFVFNDTMESVTLYIIRFYEGKKYHNDLILIEGEFVEFQFEYLRK